MMWKKLKVTVEQKPFQRDWPEIGKKQILDKPQSVFSIKKEIVLQREKTCHLQVIIFKLISFMISTNGPAILVTQKQCQLILGEPQHTNNLLHVSFRMEFTTTLRTIDQSKNSMPSQYFDGNVYYYRKVRFLYQKVKFLTSPNSSRHIACC